jgi:hypothetical protein
MSEVQPDEEGLLQSRLHGVAAGDASARQLRERYDLLQRDYETLLCRLGDLEERLRGAGEEGADVSRASTPIPSLRDQIRAPLLRLRQEYDAAIDELRDLIEGLDLVATGRMKRQRGAPESGEDRPSAVRLELVGGGPAEILDFQERLGGIPGVVRVTVEALEHDRATISVELGHPPRPETRS